MTWSEVTLPGKRFAYTGIEDITVESPCLSARKVVQTEMS